MFEMAITSKWTVNSTPVIITNVPNVAQAAGDSAG